MILGANGQIARKAIDLFLSDKNNGMLDTS